MPGGTMAPAGLSMIAAYNQPVSFGSIPLCVASPGQAAITGVAIHDLRGNLSVDAFGVRSSADGMLGEVHRALASVNGFDLSGPQVVAAVCPRDAESATTADFVELALQVTLTSGDQAGGPGLDITYQAGGAIGTYMVPFGVQLCTSDCPDPWWW